MKKVKIFVLMLVAGAAIFTSCKKDDETVLADPTISFQGGVNSLVFNGTNSIDVNVTVAAEGKIESVTLQGPSLSGTGTTSAPITSTFGTSHTDNAKNQTSAVYLFQVSTANLALALVNHTSGFTYTFTVTDQEGKSTTATFTVTVPAANTPFATEVTTGTFYHIAGLLEGAWDLDGNAVVSSGGAAASKSMVNSDVAGNAFTGSWGSNAANGTQFAKITGTTYANIYQENAVTLFTGSATTVTNPTVGDVYIAKKGASTYYVIEITALDPAFSTGTGGNHGKITFKYKK